MAIRRYNSDADLTISVALKNGDVYTHRDTTDPPLDKNGDLVAFWENEHDLMVFPMDMVDHIVLHFEEDESEEG